MHVMRRHSIHRVLVSDNANKFRGVVLARLEEMCNIKKVNIIAFQSHSWGKEVLIEWLTRVVSSSQV